MSIANSNNSTTKVAKAQKRAPRDAWELFDAMASPAFMRWDLSNQTQDGFLPHVDVHEDSKAITIDVELAGIPKEDIHVEVHEGVLTVSGEKKYEKRDDKDGKAHRIERRYGSFSRAIHLPDTAQADAITAKSDNGVLHVVVPKKEPEKAAAKKIAIQ